VFGIKYKRIYVFFYSKCNVYQSDILNKIYSSSKASERIYKKQEKYQWYFQIIKEERKQHGLEGLYARFNDILKKKPSIHRPSKHYDNNIIDFKCMLKAPYQNNIDRCISSKHQIGDSSIGQK